MLASSLSRPVNLSRRRAPQSGRAHQSAARRPVRVRADISELVTGNDIFIAEGVVVVLAGITGLAFGPLAKNNETIKKMSIEAQKQQPKGTWSPRAKVINDSKMKSLTVKEIQEAVAKGWKIVDVSPPEDFAEFHIPGSVNVPYVLNGSQEGNAIKGILQQVMGASPRYENPQFLEQLSAATGGAGVVFACPSGGTIETSVNFPEGKPSRSLVCCAKVLQQNPAAPVAHMKGGLGSWFAAGMEGEGEGDLESWKKMTGGKMPGV